MESEQECEDKRVPAESVVTILDGKSHSAKQGIRLKMAILVPLYFGWQIKPCIAENQMMIDGEHTFRYNGRCPRVHTCFRTTMTIAMTLIILCVALHRPYDPIDWLSYAFDWFFWNFSLCAIYYILINVACVLAWLEGVMYTPISDDIKRISLPLACILRLTSLVLSSAVITGLSVIVLNCNHTPPRTDTYALIRHFLSCLFVPMNIIIEFFFTRVPVFPHDVVWAVCLSMLYVGVTVIYMCITKTSISCVGKQIPWYVPHREDAAMLGSIICISVISYAATYTYRSWQETPRPSRSERSK